MTMRIECVPTPTPGPRVIFGHFWPFLSGVAPTDSARRRAAQYRRVAIRLFLCVSSAKAGWWYRQSPSRAAATVQRLPCAVIAVQRGREFLTLFVTVSFLKVRACAQGTRIRSQSLRCVPSRAPRRFPITSTIEHALQALAISRDEITARLRRGYTGCLRRGVGTRPKRKKTIPYRFSSIPDAAVRLSSPIGLASPPMR